MRITVKVALITAAVWISFKLTGFYMGWNTPEKLPIFILANILGVLVTISVGLYLQKSRDTESGNTLRDVKNAMTAGFPYALIVCVFLYFYYNHIDPGFNKRMLAERELYFKKVIDDPKQLKEIRKNHPDFEVKTKEEIYESMKEGPQMLFTGQFMMTFGILALLLLSTLYSLLVTIIMRKFIFR